MLFGTIVNAKVINKKTFRTAFFITLLSFYLNCVNLSDRNRKSKLLCGGITREPYVSTCCEFRDR